MIVEIFGYGATEDSTNDYNVDFSKEPIEIDVDVPVSVYKAEISTFEPVGADYNDYIEKTSYIVDYEAIEDYVYEQVNEELENRFDDYSILSVSYDEGGFEL